MILKSLLITSLIANSRKYFLLCILLIFSSRFDIEYCIFCKSCLPVTALPWFSYHSCPFSVTLMDFFSLLFFFLTTLPELSYLWLWFFRAIFLNPHFRPVYKPSDFYFWLLINCNYLCNSEVRENSECQN